MREIRNLAKECIQSNMNLCKCLYIKRGAVFKQSFSKSVH